MATTPQTTAPQQTETQASGSSSATTNSSAITSWHDLATRVLDGDAITAAEALAVLDSSDAELMEVIAAASRPRFHHFGDTVKVNYLVNLKSGLCPEDCFYCSQRLNSDAGVLRYSWLSTEEAVAAAGAGIGAGASRVCLVASGTGPSNREVGKVEEIIQGIKSATPGVEVCACLGALKHGQAETLCASGADAYNHNLNTAESHYAEICTTHTYADREHTVGQATDAGLSPCSGFIAGMGETREQLVELAMDLRAKDVDSIPVNFLLPFDGTPLAGVDTLNPRDCLRILAMVRLVNPATEVRVAAGRERHLGHLQGTALFIANSLFLGDYLTSEGQPGGEDLQMIADAGLRVLETGSPEDATEGSPESDDEDAAAVATAHAGGEGAPTVAIRNRGAGTSEPANA